MTDDTLTLFDLGNRAQIELRGRDRQSFLNNFCTNDVKALQPGEGCEAFLTSIKGRILGHLIVCAADESLWIDSVPGSNDAVVAHLDKYLITEDVEIVDRTGDLATLCLAGTPATAWLKEHAGIEELPLWGQQSADVDGTSVVVRQVGFTEAPGFELIVSRDQRPALESFLLANGATSGTSDQFESLRIEAGFPHYGIDLTDENIAQEAGRNEQAISFTKGCYLGQEPIARLDALGHTNKELCRLRLAAGPAPAAGDRITSDEGQEIGQVTSAATSMDGSTVAALALLKTAFTKSGTSVQVTTGGPPQPATVE